jgi:hypothetical protein
MGHRLSIPRRLCLAAAAASLAFTGCRQMTIFDQVKQATQAALAPQIVVTQGDSTVAKDAQIDLGSVTKDESLDVAFTVTNKGQSTLQLNGTPAVEVSGSTVFSALGQPATSISPGQSTAFSLRYCPTDLTRQVAHVVIRSNDPKSNPFTFSLAGTGVGTPIPQINIKFNSLSVAPGSSVDVGFTTPSVPRQAVFTVLNQGKAALTLTGIPPVDLSNTQGNALQMTQQPESTVLPDMSSTFSMEFLPTATGTYKAHAAIASNDPNHPSYAFDLTGTCVQQGTVVAPNGGEAYRPGTACMIQWSTFGGGNVKLELLKNYVVSATIAGSIPDTGSYNWTIPSLSEGNDYMVKASSLANPDVNDTSDAPFAIGTVAVTAPNGGEVLLAGSSATITWTSGIGGLVRIDLLKNAQAVATIAPSTNNTGSYSWIIPADLSPGSDYTIAVSTLTTPSVTDASNAAFVVENLAVTTPNGGEGYQPSTTCPISWTSSGWGSVKIDLYRGGVFNAVITSSTANSGTYSWPIPFNQAVGTDYTVRITHKSNAAIMDESNAPFVIGTIAVTSPAGGETWKPEEIRAISWSSAIGGTVAIDLYESGVLSSSVCATTANSGTYSWTVPALSGRNYRIRVRSIEYSAIWGESPATFAAGTITVTSPNGGEVWAPGEHPTITWSSAIGGTVGIDLYKSGALDRTIAASADNTGSYSAWTVPALSGADYSVRVTSNLNASIVDSSDAFFAVGTITVTAPNGGASYVPTTSTAITWSSVVGGNVKIELWKAGAFDSTIIASTANTGSYSWTIPSGQAESTQYRIKVSSLSNASVADSSDADFTISYWIDLGLVAAVNGAFCQIAIGTDNLPVVAYKNTTTTNLQVAKWNGTGWTDLGSPASGNGVEFSLAAIGNTPEIVYVDVANGSKPHVKVWSNGTMWTDYGYLASSAVKSVSICGFYVAVATTSNQVGVYDYSLPSGFWTCGTFNAGTVYLGAHALVVCNDAHGNPHPVVVYSEYSTDSSISYKPHVWFGTRGSPTPYTWQDLGYPSSGSSFQSTDNSLAATAQAADPMYGQHPLIMYVDGNKLQVMQWSYSGSSWQDKGVPYSGTVTSGYNSLGDKGAFVSFRDNNSGGRGRLVRGSSWTDLGYFSSSQARYTGVVIDGSDGNPVVIYSDVDAGNAPHVKKRYLP